VKNKQNQVLVDLKQDALGRGCYICKNEKCLKNATNRKGLDAFSLKLNTRLSVDKLEEIKTILF